MKPNEIAAARLSPPEESFAGGGFVILRPRLNVAAKIIARLLEGGLEPERDNDAHQQGKAKADARHFAAPRGAASVTPTKPETRAGVAYCCKSHGQASP